MTLSVLHPQPQLGDPHDRATTTFGTVTAVRGDTAEVETVDGVIVAQRSSSCLVSLALGDRVLVACEDRESYVLVVLKSQVDETRMEFRGDLDISVANEVTLRAAKLCTDVDEGRIGFGALRFVGQALEAKAKQIRMVAETCDTLASRIYQKAGNFLRRTDELDAVASKNMDRRAEGLVHFHGKNVVTTAEQLTKIDAAQVHVG